MHFKIIFILYFLTFSECVEDFDDEIDNGDELIENDFFEIEITTAKPPSKVAQQKHLDLPEDIIIEYENASSYIKEQNHNIEHMMGVSDERCDNARLSLATDFDPANKTEVHLNTFCEEDETFKVDRSVLPRLTIVQLPNRYIPIHRCMRVKIKYLERIPTVGPHRPLWARHGEYKYVPPQRWLHNVEHGAIVVLYHPCADQDEVEKLKTLVKKCLWRHVITPFPTLTKERPLAIVGWSAHLEMSHFDFELVKNFVKFYAKSGPERQFRDGQYRHLLIERAQLVTNVIDSQVCPGM